MSPPSWCARPLAGERDAAESLGYVAASHVHRTWQSGWHRRQSYWALAGAGASRPDQAAIRPADVAATVVHLLGRDLPAGFNGAPFAEQQVSTP